MRIVKSKKIKIILATAAVFAAIAVLLTFKMSLAYLTDAERKDNIITIGNVDLELSEGKYKDEPVIAAGGAPQKAPVISNTGISDEYVFIRVAVPVRKVTLLYEEDSTVDETRHKKGTPTVNNYNGQSVVQQSDEIYRTVADGHGDASKTQISLLEEDNDAPNAKPQLDIEYNKGDGNGDNKKVGWVYLGRKLNQQVNVSTTDTPDNRTYDYYYFGYNRRLKAEADASKKVYQYKAVSDKDADNKPLLENGIPVTETYYMTEQEFEAAFPATETATFPAGIPNDLQGAPNKSKWTKEEKVDETIPLFDRIQLKSFIDEELVLMDGNNVSDVEDYFYVQAYGIQADSLGTDSLNNLARDAVLTDDQVKEIFGIVKRKAGGR